MQNSLEISIKSVFLTSHNFQVIMVLSTVFMLNGFKYESDFSLFVLFFSKKYSQKLFILLVVIGITM
ncbi:TPA: hypothetical protein DEG21_02915 [Patescibacteria group bacterium]|nr:hypothetical protein [Candidatus Gracilibacteria bacterium]HBY74822.1 hypothetical protein [Candidatus Gracilibacteria bacterium]